MMATTMTIIIVMMVVMIAMMIYAIMIQVANNSKHWDFNWEFIILIERYWGRRCYMYLHIYVYYIDSRKNLRLIMLITIEILMKLYRYDMYRSRCCVHSWWNSWNGGEYHERWKSKSKYARISLEFTLIIYYYFHHIV